MWLGRLPDYKVVKAVPVIVLDADIPREPKNSKFKQIRRTATKLFNQSTICSEESFIAAFESCVNIPFVLFFLIKFHISVFTWGRRMSKKFELLRRNDSRKLHEDGTQMVRKSCPSASASADMLNGRNMLSLRSMPKHSLVTEEMQTPPAAAVPVMAASAAAATATTTATTTSSSTNGGYSFKTFFHRIGSTGMLSRSNNQSSSKQLNENNSSSNTRTLYRSSSTSQLNTPSYVKG